MPNEIDVEVKAKQSGLEEVEADARKAGAKVASELEAGFDKAAESAEKASKKIGDELEKAAEEAKQAGAKAGGGFGDSLSGSLSDMVGTIGKGAAFLGGGALLGEQLLSGLQSVWEEDRVGALIAAQTGAAASAAGRLGDTAGDLFADNFGASIEDAGQALTAIFQNDLIDTTAAEEDIERLAGKVITVSDIMGEEFNAISRAAQQTVRTGLADNVSQALDMITHATQQGLNTSEDLLDTITEYGTSFREVGLQGAEAFGLLRQAQLGGARDTDFAADAIKEFGILAQDTASTASRGFQAIGLDGEKMGRMIAAGGEPAREAMRQTLNALRAMPPSIERNQAAVDLFGTKAEDLGDALFRMDLDTAKEQFGEFAGSVEEAARAIAEGQSLWDRMGKNISNATANVGEFVDGMSNWGMSDELNEGVAKAHEFEAALAQFKDSGSTEYLEELKGKYPELAGAIDEYISKNQDQVAVTEQAADANVSYAGTFDDLIEATRAAADGQISLSEASIAATEAIANAHEAADAFAGEGLNATKTGFDLNTEAGRELEGSLNDIASRTWDVVAAMREEGASAQQTEEYIKGQRGELIRAARQMGLNEDAALAYANRLLNVPRTVRTDMDLRSAAASAALATIARRLAAMPKEVRTDYYLYTHYLQSGSASVRNQSSTYGGYGGLAHGGIHGADRGRQVGRAQDGGQRNGATLINEAGPELVELPSGSRVMTAGATRAMAEMGALSGGGQAGGTILSRVVFEGDTNSAMATAIKSLFRSGALRIDQQWVNQ